ncbi:MAG: hypothetical protein U0T83_03615 [Bacteriovoracaceae bacterium]
MPILKLTFLLLTLFFILSGCDTGPRDRRSRTTYGSPLNTSSSTTGSVTTTSPATTTTTTTTATVQATATAPTNEDYLNTPGFSKCTINRNSSFKYQNNIIGAVSVCGNLTDETIIRVKFGNTEKTTNNTCIFPTFKDQTNQSFYLGTAECFTHDANQIIDLKLYKNRGGYFSQYPINGIMIMKKDLIFQYVDCMNEIDPYVMWDKCTKFKNTQGYLDIAL